jgi:5-methylcytosine-specific restriction endonuclease McrA
MTDDELQRVARGEIDGVELSAMTPSERHRMERLRGDFLRMTWDLFYVQNGVPSEWRSYLPGTSSEARQIATWLMTLDDDLQRRFVAFRDMVLSTIDRIATCWLCWRSYPREVLTIDGACPECSPRVDRSPPRDTRVAQYPELRRAIASVGKDVATITVDEWCAALRYFQQSCAYCGGAYVLVEHVTPAGLPGGDTSSENCVPACLRCNVRKSSRRLEQLVGDRRFDQVRLERIRMWLADDGLRRSHEPKVETK